MGDDGLLAWGSKFALVMVVPQLVPTGNRKVIAFDRASCRRRIVPSYEAKMFKEHLSVVAREALMRSKRGPGMAGIVFPIPVDCLIRLDSFFGFRPDEAGRRRMETTDEDNLKKGVYDALKGLVFADDRQIVEGYFAKGECPPEAKGEVILCSISRAGYRKANELNALMELGSLWPWRAEDRSPILRPDSVRMRNIYQGGENNKK